MKRVEATIQADKVGAVSDAIKEIVGGYTVLEGNGRGSGKRQTIKASNRFPSKGDRHDLVLVIPV